MDAYTYRTELHCADCTQKIKAYLLFSHEHLDETEYDSDDYPKGPVPDGGGEADYPASCGTCHVFLENPLTEDGEFYVYEALADKDGDPGVLAEWEDYYSYLIDWE